MVGDADPVFAVLGNIHAEVTVRAARIVVADHRSLADPAHVHERIQRRADPPCVAANVHACPFLAINLK